MFKIGDYVKLRSYDGYSDYTKHNDEVGMICEPLARLEGSGYDYSILWTDGAISNAVYINIKLHIKEWDDEINR